jgi:hypothetical protein
MGKEQTFGNKERRSQAAARKPIGGYGRSEYPIPSGTSSPDQKRPLSDRDIRFHTEPEQPDFRKNAEDLSLKEAKKLLGRILPGDPYEGLTPEQKALEDQMAELERNDRDEPLSDEQQIEAENWFVRQWYKLTGKEKPNGS